MRLYDEINFLRTKVDFINGAIIGQSRPNVVAIIETAFWARAVLEIIEGLDFKQYGHNLWLNVRLADNERPDRSKIVYVKSENITLDRLLGIIIHQRYFSFHFEPSGNHLLDVVSDKSNRIYVYYADFINAIESLLLSEKLTAKAVCDLSLSFAQQQSQKNPDEWRDEDHIFPSINEFWLLQNYLMDKLELKSKIMAGFFGITEVPDEILPSLGFFVSADGPGTTWKIGFNPSWIEGQDQYSKWFERELLFNLIRQ